MTDDIRRMFDVLDAEPSPEFVSGLRARLMDVTTHDATAPAVAQSEEDLIMTISEARRDQSSAPDHGGRHAVRWLAAAAVAAGLIVTGVLVANRDDGDEKQPADEFSPPTGLEERASLDDTRIGLIAFAGGDLWSTKGGSTFLLRIDPTTAQVTESLRLPDGATSGAIEAVGDTLYVPTHGGVVVVDVVSGAMSAPRASGEAEIADMSHGDGVAWVERFVPGEVAMLEKWDADLTRMEVSIDLGEVEPGSLQAVGDDVYLGTGSAGLVHYSGDGTRVGAIDVGYVIDMSLAPDGRLWVPDYDDGTLRAIDTANDEIVGEVPVFTNGTISADAVNGSVFAVNWANGTLHAIDPETYSETAFADTPSSPLKVLVVGTTIWVSGEGFLRSFVAS